MAIPSIPTFYSGLVLIMVGTGLLKPNVSTMVADLYPEGGAKRDRGFSIFYMGINLGAFFGPILCGLLGENYSWHLGFSLAGIGMVLGLFQYWRGLPSLEKAGNLKTGEDAATLARRSRNFYFTLIGLIALIAVASVPVVTGVVNITLQQVAEWLGYGIVALAVLYFVYLHVAGGHTAEEKRRLVVIFWIFILAALFWSGFEQAGSSMNLFAEGLTNRFVLGWETPASWLQSVNPILIMLLAPVFGWLWTWLAARNANPSIPLKFALGLLGLSAGFLVMSWGAAGATPESPVSPNWLIATYFLHTCGELCLSPVGLSAITKLAPQNRVGQMMGVWFIAAALGNLFAGLVAAQLESLAPSALFWNVTLIVGGGGVVALLVSPLFKRLTGDIK